MYGLEWIALIYNRSYKNEEREWVEEEEEEEEEELEEELLVYFNTTSW